MNKRSLNFFFGFYIVLFLILITPFGALFFLIFGKAPFFMALGTLALAIGVIYMQKQETIKASMVFDLVVLIPVFATIIIGRLFWIKVNNKEIGMGISNQEIFLYLWIFSLVVLVVFWLDERRKQKEEINIELK